jgi:GntR family transcriptional repressor for pyruvate dehydrogenase complex
MSDGEPGQLEESARAGVLQRWRGGHPALRTVRSASASDNLVAQVRAALFRGELKPGDFLGSETEIATELGVSRVPVRDAFRSLQAMGIIEVRVGANGGARIAQGNPARYAEALAVQFKLVGVSVEELFESQLATETAAAELAAGNATADDIARLDDILVRLRGLVDDPETFTRLSLDFHRGVVEASHNRALIAQSQALLEVLHPVLVPQTTRTLAIRVLRKHRRLLGYIRSGDGAMARAAMAEHLDNVSARVLPKAMRRPPARVQPRSV